MNQPIPGIAHHVLKEERETAQALLAAHAKIQASQAERKEK